MLDRIRQILVRLSEFRKIRSMRLRRIIMVTAVLFLVGGIAASLHRQPDILSNLDWRPVLLILTVGVPVTALFNSLEFQLSGRLIGASISLRHALEITIIGSAANMMPLPGGTLVRVAALKASGAGYRASTAATLLIAMAWIAVSFLFASGGLWFVGGHWLAGVFFAVGLATLLLSFGLGIRLSRTVRVPLQVMLVKLALVITDASRIYFCLWALGVEATFPQAAAFCVAGVVGSAASIVPAGLGVREAVSAALAPVVQLPAAAGFLGATLNRLLGLVVTAPLALWLTLRQKKKMVQPMPSPAQEKIESEKIDKSTSVQIPH